MDLYIIGLKLYLFNRACGGIPLNLAAHFVTAYALSATWWTTKKTVGLLGYGTYKMITYAIPSRPVDTHNNNNADAIEANWDSIEPPEYAPTMDWDLIDLPSDAAK